MRGKLVDYFVELNDKTKLDLQAVKTSYTKSGHGQKSLVGGKALYYERPRLVREAAEFVEEHFVQADLTKALVSAILLQYFITGLCMLISH